MHFGERAPDLRGDGFRVQRVERFTAHFTGDDDPLNVVDVDREGRRCIRRQRGVAFLRGLFEILRVVIAAGHDDEVFQTAGDEQILAIDETEIARAQVPCVVAIQLRAEGAFRFLETVPVADADARPVSQISPIRPGAQRSPVSGFTIRRRCSAQGRPQETSAWRLPESLLVATPCARPSAS